MKTNPIYTEESIQQALYLRHPILKNPAFEMLGFIFYAWESDYLAISDSGYVYECEIKISHSDFLNEAKHKAAKMRLLGVDNMSMAEYHNWFGISEWEKPMPKPNYFYYVCPEGVISEAECPKFAGLIYINDSGLFRCVKTAPVLHKEKYDLYGKMAFMRNKFYYAMWNWIRRYWQNIGKAKDIAPQTAAAYERSLDKQAEEIDDLKYQIHSLTRWHDPKEELPDTNRDVLIKTTMAVKYQIAFYKADGPQHYHWQEDNDAIYDDMVVGWREIHE